MSGLQARGVCLDKFWHYFTGMVEMRGAVVLHYGMLGIQCLECGFWLKKHTPMVLYIALLISITHKLSVKKMLCLSSIHFVWICLEVPRNKKGVNFLSKVLQKIFNI